MNGPESKDYFLQENTAQTSPEENIFKRYPLLGSYIPSERSLQVMDNNTRKAIENKLVFSKGEFPDNVKLQMVLSVINHAKDWDSKNSDPQDEDEELDHGFWAYIALQYGYREYEAIEKILKDTIYSVLKKYNKAFFVVSHKRRYRASIVAHAMAPKKSMMALLNLLFDFYKNNLDWNIVEGDPLLDVMIQVLQQRFGKENSTTSDLGVTVSNQAYYIQEGIKKLVLDYPDIARNLFEKLLKRIDDLINSRKCPVKVFEDQLCEEWYKEKLSEISESRSTARGKKNGHREIVVDYSKIRMKLVLKDENDICLVWPDIRLKDNLEANTKMTVYYGGSVVLQQPIASYGNELGWSLEGGSISLPDFSEDLNTFDIHVRIARGDEEIFHDRILPDGTKVLFFSSDRQISANSVKQGGFTLVAPDSVDVNIDSANVTPIDPFRINGLKACFVELEEGYAVYADGTLLSFDHESNMNIRVMVHGEFSGLPEINAGQTACQFARRGSECFVAVPNGKAKQYAILKNGEKLELDELSKQQDGSEEIYSFLLTGEDGICRIQVLDLGKDKEIYDASFMLINHGEIVFNRDFYYVEKDWENAELEFQIDDLNETLPFGMAEDEITIPFRDGIIHVPVPKVTVKEMRGSWLNLNGAETVQFIDNIPQESLIEISIPPETEVSFFIGGQQYDGEGPVDVGNKLMSFLGRENTNFVKIEMEIRGERDRSRYLLATVYLREQFLVAPEFWAKDGELHWNHGEKLGEIFIGEPDKIFELTLTGKSGDHLDFHLNEDSESLMLPANVEDGVYHFEISEAGGYFDDGSKVLAQGECAIGDPDILRFLDRRIVIDTITADVDEEGRSEHVQVKTCYIGNIEFEGIQDTSEGMCPVYSGILYFENRGQNREFFDREYTDKWGNKHMKVNPVRIIYLQEGVLCVSDSEGDGLYYKKLNGTSSEFPDYEITDIEYTKENQKNYFCADLYLYTTEEDHHV